MGVPYFVLPPVSSWYIAKSVDILQWGTLTTCCCFISVMSGRLYRSLRLTEAGERLQAATIASIGDGIITTNTSGEIVFMNEEAKRLTGCAQENIGNPLGEVFKVIDEKTREPVRDPLKDGENIELSSMAFNCCLLISRNNIEIPIGYCCSPIKLADGSINGFVLVFRDLSEQRRAELSLRESEERFRTIFEQAAVGVAQVDSRTGRFVRVN
jgi:PAS domain S-box-containing protein